MIKLIAENFIRKEDIEKVIPLYKELVESTKNESGCIDYRLFVDEKDETHFTLIEEWENQKALDDHCVSEHFTKIVPAIGKYYAKEEIITIMKEFNY